VKFVGNVILVGSVKLSGHDSLKMALGVGMLGHVEDDDESDEVIVAAELSDELELLSVVLEAQLEVDSELELLSVVVDDQLDVDVSARDSELVEEILSDVLVAHIDELELELVTLTGSVQLAAGRAPLLVALKYAQTGPMTLSRAVKSSKVQVLLYVKHGPRMLPIAPVAAQ